MAPRTSTSTGDEPVQTSDRIQPGRMPAQHLEPGEQEADLELQPRFKAPDYLGSQKLKGRIALISGGDSGIGRAVAVIFAREGADVAIIYHSSDEDAEETRRHVEEEGTRCLLLRGDVRDREWCKQAVERTVQTLGGLDILVNNAGYHKHVDSIMDIDDERLCETWEINMGGYFRLTQAALPHLKRGSSIVNTGSVTGLRGSADLLDYASTKGAIHAFTKSLASNLLERGIRVNAVAPGPVWTPLNPSDIPAQEVAEFGRDADMKRPAQPEELSPAYVFLAAPSCSSYITGIVLPVTGSVGSI
ncbi:SDR family oxidoreductase [Hydrogenophaga pseudoflava]|uniref:SDR family oxidoreductase n=1 Tax=Hydrogenophaga pseudoflava TaxID=47421 RepID=UPI0027E4D18B|nr:SDR family oxidoreductase [Hydrogenophaga pseudoflava]MDQ7744409.1 SDR family oxidoreductase [Hydrogenophaga pseudoflava]